jgi:hypothetical protein
MKRILMFLVGISLFTIQANAGILLEPFLGYSLNLKDFTLGSAAGPVAGQHMKIDANGLGFGARVGYSFKPVFAAVEYSTGTFTPSLKEAPAGLTIGNNSVTVTSLGIAVGADLMLFRPYLVYIFDDQSKDSSATEYGTGYKLGVGFGFLPKVKINLEYVTKTYSKSKDGSGNETTYSQSTTFSASSVTGYGVSVSVPFEF